MDRMSINFINIPAIAQSQRPQSEWVIIPTKEEMARSPPTDCRIIVHEGRQNGGKLASSYTMGKAQDYRFRVESGGDLGMEDNIVTILAGLAQPVCSSTESLAQQDVGVIKEEPSSGDSPSNKTSGRRAKKAKPMRSCKKEPPRLVFLKSDKLDKPAQPKNARPMRSGKRSRIDDEYYYLMMEEYEGVGDALGLEENDENDEDYEEAPKVARPVKIDTSVPHEIVRSFACDKHSKWKKKCPFNCPRRKETVTSPGSQIKRKLWTKRESAMLLKWVKDEDPQFMSSKEGEQRWEEIARLLSRSVNSTKKKFMRLTNQWSPKPCRASKSITTSDEDSDDEDDMSETDLCIKYEQLVATKQELIGQDELSDISPRGGLQLLPDGDDLDEGSSDGFRSGRATIVCEKHRRWKKRCPPDCQDKMEEERRYREKEIKSAEAVVMKQQQLQEQQNKKKKAASGRSVGRPAQSCKQHQMEHQKCPDDCPRRPLKRSKIENQDPKNVRIFESSKPKDELRSSTPAAAVATAVLRGKRESRRSSDPCFLYI